MTRHHALLLLIALHLPFALGFGPKLTESDGGHLPIGPVQLRTIDAARPPALAGTAALVMDLGSGRVVYQRNGDRQVPVASITKIMTVVLALERGELQSSVSIQADDLVEGSAMGLRAGDTVTFEQLLWGAMLPSGNDATQAIARVVGGGSVQRFVGMMNEKAQTLGLVNTRFTNAHGLDAPGHYSSAFDVAELTRYAMRFPLFARMVASREYEVTGARTYTIRSTNTLLLPNAPVNGATGVKTGFTDNALDCLVATFERDGRRLLVVVLGTTNRDAATADLVNYAYTQFAWVEAPTPLVAAAGLDQVNEPRSSIMVPAWQRPFLRFGAEWSPVPPVAVPAPVGVLSYFMGSQEVARLPVFPTRGARGGG